LLDEIGHDTGMSNDSRDAGGTIGSRVALDEFELGISAGRETLTSVAKRYST
jgi:hypothetical protein